MRISIEKGFHPVVNELMQELRTDDPKLAVHHIIGEWNRLQGKADQPQEEQQDQSLEDEMLDAIEDYG